MSKIKIFVNYDMDEWPLISSDVFQPIIGGASGGQFKPGFIGDDTGDNISDLNNIYKELTSNYWIHKNYLPQAREEYVGICDFRRFLDFSDSKHHQDLARSYPFTFINYKYFSTFLFNQLGEDDIMSAVKDYDVIGPYQYDLGARNNRVHFDYHYNAQEMDRALEVLGRLYPEYTRYADEFFNDTKGYNFQCVVMKRELLQDYFDWSFRILEELSREGEWGSQSVIGYYNIPVSIMERFYNIWLRYQMDKNGITVRELPGYRLSFFDFSLTEKLRYIKSLIKYKINPNTPIDDLLICSSDYRKIL